MPTHARTRCTVLMLIGWWVLAGCGSPRSGEASMIDLDTYRWNKRIALVFGASEDDAHVRQQQAWMEDEARGTDERDLVVGYIFDDAPGTLGDQALSADDADALRRRFDVAPGAFRLVLVGKDGGVKRTADAPVPAADLFEQIDAMPMRQREMDERTADR